MSDWVYRLLLLVNIRDELLTSICPCAIYSCLNHLDIQTMFTKYTCNFLGSFLTFVVFLKLICFQCALVAVDFKVPQIRAGSNMWNSQQVSKKTSSTDGRHDDSPVPSEQKCPFPRVWLIWGRWTHWAIVLWETAVDLQYGTACSAVPNPATQECHRQHPSCKHERLHGIELCAVFIYFCYI